MARRINPNLKHVSQSYNTNGITGCVLEGSSRSGKTWSILDFLPYYCSKNEGKTINIIRETYQSFKTTLYLDFNKRFPDFGLVSPFADVQERSTFKLFGNQINLIGADKPSKFMGAGCDLLWLNEAIHIEKKIFDQAEMRCSEFFIMDYNPEFTEHWIYDSVVKRPDVSFLRTTFLDNPNVPEKQKNKILGYDPSNPDNVANGTADPYNWDVFGLGKRARKEGAIYSRWIEGEFDESLISIFGIDWGWTDPFAMIEVAVDENKKKIYLREKIYKSELINWKKEVTNNSHKDSVKVCDSSQPLSIAELRNDNHNAIPAWKVQGSIVQGIKWLQQYQLVIENSPNLKNELNNYEWSDKKQNVPVDAYNHLLDAFRYAYTYYRFNILRL